MELDALARYGSCGLCARPPCRLKCGADAAGRWRAQPAAGWTEEEVSILHKALTRFGVGNWSQIMDSGCLPGKTNAQLNNQTQRMLGQQSTAGARPVHSETFQRRARAHPVDGLPRKHTRTHAQSLPGCTSTCSRSGRRTAHAKAPRSGARTASSSTLAVRGGMPVAASAAAAMALTTPCSFAAHRQAASGGDQEKD